jgi:hypothetical protein
MAKQSYEAVRKQAEEATQPARDFIAQWDAYADNHRQAWLQASKEPVPQRPAKPE